MVQIAVILFAFPIGLGRWSKRTALLLTTAMCVLLLIPQTISVNADSPDDINAGYWVIQLLTLAVGLGLTTWGHSFMTKRRARTQVA